MATGKSDVLAIANWDLTTRELSEDRQSATPRSFHKNHAMGFASPPLLRSRPTLLQEIGKRCDFPQQVASVQSCRARSSGRLSASFTRNPGFFRSHSAFSSALHRGFSNWRKQDKEESCLNRQKFAIGAASAGSDDTVPNFTDAAKCPCLYLQRTVSSGNTVRYAGGVVVLGGVEEGGAVVADGDVVILGRVCGDIHGGRNGNKSAVVYAAELGDACHIRIGEVAASVTTSQFGVCPVIASLQEDGTVGIRAAAQKLKDPKEGRNSSELRALAEKETSVDTASTASKRPAQLALFTGVYISAVGMALLIFPVPLFGTLFDVRAVTVGWIRVGAILAVVFGVYYIGTAIGDMRGSSGARAFYMSTVVGRVFLFCGFCWLVAAGAAQRALLLVGIVNLLGAVSMLFALHQESRARATMA